MSSEWYSGDNKIENMQEKELSLIQKGVNQQIIPLIVEVTGVLEDFDRDGAKATIYNRDGNSTGIELAHAIYGDPQFQMSEGRETYEQIYRITFREEHVSVLLNHDGTIKEIQKKFKENSTYTVNEWLNDKYMLLYNIIDNCNPYFYLKIRDFKYHGEEETREIEELNKSLGR